MLIVGRGNCECKVLEVVVCWLFLRNSEVDRDKNNEEEG